MNSIVMAFSRRDRNRAKIQRPRAVSTATSAAYIQAIGPWENWKLVMKTQRAMIRGMLMSQIQKIATTQRDSPMEIWPQNRSYFLPKQARGIGETIAPNQLTQPTRYDPYLAVIEIAPFLAIWAKIVFEQIIIPSRPVCCWKKQRAKAIQVDLMYLFSQQA